MSRLSCAVLFLSFPVTLGCGRGDAPRLVPVHGVLTLDGKPLGGAHLTFWPADDTQGIGAVGWTEDDGTFVLTYRHGGDGTVAGTYRVVVSRKVTADGSIYFDDDDPDGGGNGRETLPACFSDRREAKVSVTVPVQGGRVDVELLTPK